MQLLNPPRAKKKIIKIRYKELGRGCLDRPKQAGGNGAALLCYYKTILLFRRMKAANELYKQGWVMAIHTVHHNLYSRSPQP